jgi:hypothetical protein
MQIFILQASGALVEFGGRHEILCKKAFMTKELAEGYKPIFKEACITPIDKDDLFYLADDSNFHIALGKIELVE